MTAYIRVTGRVTYVVFAAKAAERLGYSLQEKQRNVIVVFVAFIGGGDVSISLTVVSFSSVYLVT